MEGPLGSAKWSDHSGRERYHVEDGNYFFFGCPIDQKTGKWDSKRFIYDVAKGHFLTVAPTRAGKGVSLIIPNLLCYRGSAIVMDPKGELAWITAPRRREFGKVCIVDPWGEVSKVYGSKVGVVEEVAHYNPLSILKPGSHEFIDNIAYLADAIIIAESTKERHWDDSARELVAGLMAYVVENPELAPYASLAAVRKLLQRPNAELERTIRRAVEDFPDSFAARKLAQFENPEKTTGIASVISTARTQTGFLDNEDLGRNMEYSDFSFDEMREGGRQMTVYLVIPPHLLASYSRWLRLMVSIAVGALQKGPLDESEIEELGIRDEVRESDKDPSKEAVPPTVGPMAGVLPSLVFSPSAKKDSREIAVPDWMESHITAQIEEWWAQQSSEFRRATEKLHTNPAELAKAKARAHMQSIYAELPKATEGPAGSTRPEPLTELPPSLRPPKTEANRAWDADEAARIAALPVLFLLDEFGTIGRLSAISTAFGLAAGTGKGISMWAFVQDLNQLKWHYPNEWETFVANASALVCFGMMDIFTLEYIEKTLGKTTIRYETKNMSKTENMRIRDDRPMGPGPSIFEGFFRDNNAPAEELAGHSISENTTQHVQAQPLASIDELRKMHRQKCIVISHDDPVMCWRVDYYSDKTFSAWARPDPKYAKR